MSAIKITAMTAACLAPELRREPSRPIAPFTWPRRVAEAYRNRRAAETLASMDDHVLRDIGVTRHQAYRLARFGRD